MRRLLLYHAVVISVLASACVCAAQDLYPNLPPTPSTSPTADLFASVRLADQPAKSVDSPSLSPVLTSFNNVLNVTTGYVTLPRETLRLKDLSAELDPDHLFTMAAKSSFFEGRLMTEGDLSYLSQESSLQTGADSRQRQGRLSVIGTEGRMRYGLNYRVAGKAASGLQDLEVREVWAEWRQNIMRLTTSLQQNWNNVDLDPAQARITRLQKRASLGIAPPAWPELAFSYSHVTLASSHEPQGVGSQQGIGQSADASLLYNGSRFHLNVASSYTKMSDSLQPQMNTVSVSHIVGGSYHLTDRVLLTPTVTWKTDQQSWSGMRVDTPSLAVSFSYQSLPKDLGFTLQGTHGTTRSSDGLIDSCTWSAKGVLSWTPPGSRLVRPSLSVEARYSSIADNVYADRSTEDSWVLVRLKLTGIAWLEYFSFRPRG